MAGGLLVLFVIFRPHGGVAYLVEDFKKLAKPSRAKLLLLAAFGFVISLAAIHTNWTADGVRGTDFDRVSLARIILVIGVVVAIAAYRLASHLIPAAVITVISLLGIAATTRLSDDLELDGTWEWTVAGCVFALTFAGAVLAKEIVDRSGTENIDMAAPESITEVPPKALALDNVSVSFGNVQALSAASLTVHPGEIVGLIGPNGAGKTTLVEAITGFVNATGRIAVDGTDISSSSATQRSRQGIARSFQSLELFEDMTVLDNIRTAADAKSAPICDRLSGLAIHSSPNPLSPPSTSSASPTYCRTRLTNSPMPNAEWWPSRGRWRPAPRSSFWTSPQQGSMRRALTNSSS